MSEPINLDMAQCSQCGEVVVPEFDYATDTGPEWFSPCCGAYLLDISDGTEWEPEFPQSERDKKADRGEWLYEQRRDKMRERDE